MSEVAPAGAPETPLQTSTFAERKQAQLQQERAERGEAEPVTPMDPENRTPIAETESTGAMELDNTQELHADIDAQLGEEEFPPADLEDETPAGLEPPEDEPKVDWEKRYKDLQSETQQTRENVDGMAQEHAQSMAEHLQLRFQLEDDLAEAKNRAKFMVQVMTGNAEQYQNINWAQVPPDKLQEVQAQAQQAFAMKQQAEQAFDQYMEYESDTLSKAKRREAEIAKTRLRRTIPGWSNETYSQLRQFAAKKGMPAEAFNDITNPVLIEALHAYHTLASGAETVRRKPQPRKAVAPRGRKQTRQPRDARGQYARAQTEPNQRGSFADKHKHRLRMEREGR